MHGFLGLDNRRHYFFMLHDVARIIRGYIPNRNCKGLIIKEVHKRETLLTPVNIYIPDKKRNAPLRFSH